MSNTFSFIFLASVCLSVPIHTRSVLTLAVRSLVGGVASPAFIRKDYATPARIIVHYDGNLSAGFLRWLVQAQTIDGEDKINPLWLLTIQTVERRTYHFA
jgi:hypothetical protein